MSVVGIDEAGRGPVLGPLVMCGVLTRDSAQEKLSTMGVKDSKLLTAEKREELYPEILKIIDSHKLVILEPAQIDKAMSTSNFNINWLEAHTAAEIVNALNPATAIIDCPSPNIRSYTEYISRLITNKQTKLILEHKAERHMPVAAASIIAKVTRDRIIGQLKKSIGIDFGSGYMHDERTQQFLQSHFETHPYLFRQMWAPFQKMQNSKHQMQLNKF